MRLSPFIGFRLVAIGDEQVGHLENEIPAAPIAHREAVRRAQAIENRQAHAQEGQMQPRRHLPAVGMGDQQITVLGLRFQILQIADQHLRARQIGQ